MGVAVSVAVKEEEGGSVAVLPLSSGQRRLWWLAQRDPGSAAYNSPVAIRFPDGADAEALGSALATLVSRHEMLRTRYVAGDDGEPGQVVDDGFVIPVTWLPGQHGADGTEAAVTRSAAEPFDLASAPPVRAVVVRQDDGAAVLVLVMHHIATDGRSLAVVVKELTTAYLAAIDGAAPVLTRPAARYADYVDWQLSPAGRTRAEEAMRYWTRELDGFVPLRLATDRPRPQDAPSAGETVEFALPAGTTKALRTFALRRRATLSGALAAAFQAVLARWTGQHDVTIGTVLSGRDRPGLEDVVGFFVNTVVLRTEVPASATFRELVRAAQAKMTAAHEHQDAPFDEVVAAVAPVRQPGHHAIFDVLYVHDGDLEAPAAGPRIGRVRVAEDSSRFDLELKTSLIGDRVTGELTYRPDLFERSSAEAITACLVRLIHWALEDPSRPLSGFRLLDDEGERRVLDRGEGPAHIVPDRTLAELFTRQAARTPHATALVADGRTLTYAELDREITRLSAALTARGAGPGSIVAISLPRSVELVVALYAVHRSGAAYLPVDPEHPEERRAFIVDDAKPHLVLDPDEVAALLAEDPAAHPAPPPTVVTPDAVAYVIYTSGSTGRPKGVAVTHRAVVNRLAWMQGEFPVSGDDRVLQKTPAGFDVSVWEFFWPLSVGAALVMAEPGGHRDPAYLAAVIREQRITNVHFVPSMLQVFLAEPAAAECRGVRRVFCSGEALSGELRARFFEVFDAELTNLYGPTEAAVEVSLWRCSPDDPPGPVPIGHPAWNTQLRVLGNDLRPVPPGVIGELYLAGVQLALGYAGRPELTAQRFVAHPHGSPGSRMYRTGDLARLRHDGAVDYLGRTDGQVKVNGVRIELGEIENVLRSHEAVADAAVVARADATGTRLVAYVVRDVAKSEPEPAGAQSGRDTVDAITAGVLRHAARSLPEQMMPGALVVLDAFPVSANGKLDRGALPDPRPAPAPDGSGPRTPLEEVLCDLFAEVLGLPETGVHTDFFRTGGHSLLGLRLISRIRAVAGAEVNIATLFETPTVAGLAQRLAEGGEAPDPFAALLPLRPSGTRPPLFCVHPAAGLSWVYSSLLRYVDGDTPVHGLQSPGLAGKPSPGTVEELADKYLPEIRSVQPHGPYRLLGWSFGGLVAHELATRLQALGEQVTLLALLDAYPLHDRRPELPEQAGTATLLRLLAESLGHRVAGGLDEPFGAGQFIDLLRAAHSALGGLDEAQVHAMAEVFGRNLRMAHAFKPSVFDGDVLVFRAEADASEYAPAPADWEPHVTGRVDVRPIACGHGEMTQPVPMSEIGPAVAAHLAPGRLSPDSPMGAVVAPR
jgi:amino acid adenylation domain-containing protein